MSDKELRKKVIRLAHSNPELREHLLPLVTDKTASQKNVYAELIIELVPYYLKAETIATGGNITAVFFKDTNGKFEKVMGMVENGKLDFTAVNTSWNWDHETAMKKNTNMGKMDLFKETKSSIGKKIEQYLSTVAKAQG